MTLKTSPLLTAVVALLVAGSTEIFACPFCDVATQTLSEEASSADAVVLARQIAEAKPIGEADDPNSGMAKFEIVEVLRGQDVLGETKQFDVVYFGEFDPQQMFRVVGLGTETLDWTTPLPVSKAAEDYVRKLPTLPPSGVDRMTFFQDYLEHEDPLLAQDAYDEFARSPYEDVLALGPKMQHDKLVNWITDLEISPSRRRLYLTMLGACGGPADIPMLEAMIVSNFDALEPQLKQALHIGLAAGGPVSLPVWLDLFEQRERQKKLGLDALVACYLTLRGGEGLDLIDQRFLKDPKVDYTHIYSTIMALRFHGDQETGAVPKERLLASVRLLLDNPDFADQVILDLSRWEDWSVLDRLVDMFKKSDAAGYVRQPVVTYLTVAGDQPGDVGGRAKAALAELEQFDPASVKQARSLMAFGALSRARAESSAAASDTAASKTDEAVADTQGFTASAEDEATDPAEIADPTTFEDRKETTVAKPQDTDQNQKPEEASETKAAENEFKPAPTTQAATLPLDQTSNPEPLLLVGVPLFALVLLMGVYWMILRVGAL
jgi:hypothetical protein